MFLCSKCVLQHTGVGHSVKEFTVDSSKITEDFQDVSKVFDGIYHEVTKDKAHFDKADKRLQELCMQQVNMISLAFDSLVNNLAAKRKEMKRKVTDFYEE